jgi:hypothetical protein
MEYALKYQKNLKGLIISNMMASIPEYNAYAQEVLAPQMDPTILKELQEWRKTMILIIQNTANLNIIQNTFEKVRWKNVHSIVYTLMSMLCRT